jgi:hypothetical protein
MPIDQDIKDLVYICNGQQSLIDGLIAAVSHVRAGEELEPKEQLTDLISRGKNFQIRINEMRTRHGLK